MGCNIGKTKVIPVGDFTMGGVCDEEQLVWDTSFTILGIKIDFHLFISTLTLLKISSKLSVSFSKRLSILIPRIVKEVSHTSCSSSQTPPIVKSPTGITFVLPILHWSPLVLAKSFRYLKQFFRFKSVRFMKIVVSSAKVSERASDFA